MRTLILDNEAVQALAVPDHAKHRTVVAHLAGVIARGKKGATVRAVVPTAVRVEAGWNRSDPGAAAINRFRVTDAVLDKEAANLGAEIVEQTGLSVADAHLGAVVRIDTADEVIVLTSDPDDVVRASAPKAVTAIRV